MGNECSLTPRCLSLRHEWPENWDENAAYDPEDDVEGHADFREVGEAITARAKHVGVGLMSDGRGKTRGTTKHDRNGKWSRIDSAASPRSANAIGLINKATALLLISSVRTVASKYITESVIRPEIAPVTPLAMRWAAPVFSMAAPSASMPKIM